MCLGESQFRVIIVLAVCVAGLFAYSNSFTNEFVWDDVSSVLHHEHVQDPSKFFQLFAENQHAFSRGQGNFYRPLVSASFMLDFALARKSAVPVPVGEEAENVSPFLCHLTNLIWHLAATLLFFALLTRMDAPRFVRAAAPLIYVVHPLQTEAVTYISGRADPMCATFLFAALWFAMLEGTQEKRTIGAILSSVCFVAALLTKESATIFPVLLLLFILCRPVATADGNARRAFLLRAVPLAPAVALVGLYTALRLTVLDFRPESQAGPGLPFFQRLIETGQAFALYLRLFILPTGLHMERTLQGAPVWLAVVGYALLVAAILLLCHVLRTRQHRFVLGIGWFLICWVPISGLFPLNAPMAEHWLYLPMAGLLWALAEFLWPRLQPRLISRRTAYVTVYAICTLFTLMTLHRNRDWRSNESIYLATLKQNPDSRRAQFNLAVTYGDILGNPSGACRHYQRFLQVVQASKHQGPQEPQRFSETELETYLSLGKIYADWQLYDRAAQYYGLLLKLKPTEPSAVEYISTAAFGMGKCYLAFGDIQRARSLFAQALKGRPDLRPELEQLLGIVPAEAAAT